VLARRNQQFDLIDREKEQPRHVGQGERVEENQNRQMPRRDPNLAGRVAAANAYDIERLIQQNRELTAHIRAMEERQENLVSMVLLDHRAGDDLTAPGQKVDEQSKTKIVTFVIQGEFHLSIH